VYNSFETYHVICSKYEAAQLFSTLLIRN